MQERIFLMFSLGDWKFRRNWSVEMFLSTWCFCKVVFVVMFVVDLFRSGCTCQG